MQMFWVQLLVSAVVFCEVDPVIESQLRSEAIRNWNDDERAIDGLEVEISIRKVVVAGTDDEIDETNAERVSWRRQKIAWAPSKSRCLVETLLDSPFSERRVFNERYEFVVDREDKDTSYVLSQCSRHNPNRQDIRSEQLLSGSFGQVRSYLRSSFSLGGRPLRILLNDRRFRLVSARNDGDGDDALVRVEFVYEGQDPKVGILGGRYWGELMPQHHWRVHRSGVRFAALSGTGEVLESNTLMYRSNGDEGPLPERLLTRLSYSESSRVEEETVEFGVATPIQREDTEFYLPYYGIPETVVDELTPRSIIRWWFLGLGLVTLLIALVLIRNGRGRGSSTSPLGTCLPGRRNGLGDLREIS
jgi:hypothetical protein